MIIFLFFIIFGLLNFILKEWCTISRGAKPHAQKANHEKVLKRVAHTCGVIWAERSEGPDYTTSVYYYNICLYCTMVYFLFAARRTLGRHKLEITVTSYVRYSIMLYIYMYMYVCMYVYIYIYIHIHIHIRACGHRVSRPWCRRGWRLLGVSSVRLLAMARKTAGNDWVKSAATAAVGHCTTAAVGHCMT